MPYVGNNWSDASTGLDVLLGIDLSPYLAASDALQPGTLTRVFYPVVGVVPGYTAILQGFPFLIGTTAFQAIQSPPAAQYLLGFTCQTETERVIELWSFFTSRAKPPNTTP